MPNILSAPVANYEIEGLGPEVGLEVGHLFAVAKAKDDADGQLRVALKMNSDRID